MDKIENVSIVLASVIGIENIKSVLGIIILSFQAVLIIYKIIKAIVNKVKKNDYNIEDDIKTGIDELNNLIDKDGDSK